LNNLPNWDATASALQQYLFYPGHNHTTCPNRPLNQQGKRNNNHLISTQKKKMLHLLNLYTVKNNTLVPINLNANPPTIQTLPVATSPALVPIATLLTVPLGAQPVSMNSKK
jgi:hypothetical protein